MIAAIFLFVCFLCYIHNIIDGGEFFLASLMVLFFYYPLAALFIIGLILLIHLLRFLGIGLKKVDFLIDKIEEQSKKFKDNKYLYFFFKNFGYFVPLILVIIILIFQSILNALW